MSKKNHKQVLDLKAQKGMTRAQSNEHLRNFSRSAFERKRAGNFDPTREHLDFEVTKGGTITSLNKAYSIPQRMADSLMARGIKDPNAKWFNAINPVGKPRYRTIASFILGGSTEDMRQLAFGDQKVDFNEEHDHVPDNSQVTRQRGIENWAVDVYNFMVKKYGEENIIAFVVHLDEMNPHVHCTVLPVADGKISWNKVFMNGTNNKYVYSDYMIHLQDDFAVVNAKYGLERGDRGSKDAHVSYAEYLRKQNEAKRQEGAMLDEENERKRGIEESLKKSIAAKENTSNSLDDQIKQKRTKIRGLTTMLLNLKTTKSDIEKDIEELEVRKSTLTGDTSKIDMQMAMLRKKLIETDEKIDLRQKQIEEAKKSFENLQSRIRDGQTQLQRIADRRFDMQEVLSKDEGQAFNKVKANMECIGWEAAVLDSERRFSKLAQEKANWTPTERAFFDEHVSKIFEGSFLQIIGENGSEIVSNATNLFLQITTPATGIDGGGGSAASSSELRWDGRKAKENEEDYKIRCFVRGMHIATKGKSKKKKSDRGLHM